VAGEHPPCLGQPHAPPDPLDDRDPQPSLHRRRC
jgi:hypothetical protein